MNGYSTPTSTPPLLFLLLPHPFYTNSKQLPCRWSSRTCRRAALFQAYTPHPGLGGDVAGDIDDATRFGSGKGVAGQPDEAVIRVNAQPLGNGLMDRHGQAMPPASRRGGHRTSWDNSFPGKGYGCFALASIRHVHNYFIIHPVKALVKISFLRQRREWHEVAV